MGAALRAAAADVMDAAQQRVCHLESGPLSTQDRVRVYVCVRVDVWLGACGCVGRPALAGGKADAGGRSRGRAGGSAGGRARKAVTWNGIANTGGNTTSTRTTANTNTTRATAAAAVPRPLSTGEAVVLLTPIRTTSWAEWHRTAWRGVGQRWMELHQRAELKGTTRGESQSLDENASESTGITGRDAWISERHERKTIIKK
jgi:hypothetical protein